MSHHDGVYELHWEQVIAENAGRVALERIREPNPRSGAKPTTQHKDIYDIFNQPER